MIIPMRCFTCGKPIAHKWEKYNKIVTETHNKTNNIKKTSTNKVTPDTSTIEKKTLTELGLNRYCCRRMFLTHIDMTNKIS